MISIPAQDLTIPVIAIDGGAGTGKGTVRAMVAKRLGFHGFDSGLLYRAVGMMSSALDARSTEELVEIAFSLDVRMDGEAVYLEGREVTSEIRGDEAGKLASIVAQIPEARDALRAFQIGMRKRPGLVTDGRDQCDLFETRHRFFFKTEPEERARRRVRQFAAMGKPADYDAILAEIRRRDEVDMKRTASPLRPHPKALIIDTTYRSAENVADKVIAAYHYGYV